jgi:hypothetical protein
MPSKKSECKRSCNDCEATIRQMFTLDEMKMIRDSLSDVWCESKHWTNMKSVLTKLRAVISEVEEEQHGQSL